MKIQRFERETTQKFNILIASQRITETQPSDIFQP